ncbi:shikimate dehydrogenase [Conexibacter sp. CPCC 206217]|uniref:shikimate dehydrogenase family protein n=1 Tax=Conexibacter sp. CPCC 206217 TaxID=3064574 RepID=UPI002725A2D8|nr:shikimate dehydrogenase [Conexibacter sp. CPCC 206217]MDO8210837.1 shikimate dehydrogenase [Conexibacter sp. CPCC 206217]
MGGRCGVLGWPVRHSRSPAMHEAAYAALGLEGWTYQLLPVPPELLEETVRGLEGAGFTGANATIPHKHAVLALADSATDRARAIGAANTLTFDGGRIHADNTDAPAVVEALPFDVAGATALVLGAGGTARSAVWALLDAGAADVLVWNRTRERAERLTAELGGRVVDGEAVTALLGPIDDVAPRGGGADRVAPIDLLLNTTAVGLATEQTQFDHLPLSAADVSAFRCVVDFVYGAQPTDLIAAARAAGVETVDGLEILVRQGAIGFEHWTGKPAPLDVMRTAARG